jgi:hypothetical protein
MFTFLFAALPALMPEAKPTVVWVSEPVRPGQTVMILGDGFERCQNLTFRQGTRRETVATLQTRPRSVKAVVPRDFTSGPFEVVAQGTLIPVNKPRILWAQGGATDTNRLLTPGGTVRLFGTGFSWSGSKPVALFESIGNAKRSLRVGCIAPDDFSVKIPLPKMLPPGRYTLRVSATPGSSSWSDPVKLTVSALPPAARTESVTSYGASGMDGLDDTNAVLKTIQHVSANGGGTVLFPRGRFLLTKDLDLPPGVTLRGAGMERTALCWPDTEKPPAALIKGTHDFSVEDLTLYATNHGHGIAGDLGAEAKGNVRVARVRLRMNPYRGHLTEEQVASRFTVQQKSSTGGADCLRLGGPNIQVLDCDVAGGGRSIYLSGARNSVVARNRLANGRWGWYCISGSDGLVFEENVITNGDLMSTGGGLNCLDGSMVSQNVYFARNHIGECPGWDREAMTSDAGGGAYYGRLASCDGAALKLASTPKWDGRDWKGAAVFILDGRGQGQYRQIVKTNGEAVLLDRPWAVVPDGTSVVTITMLQRNYLFIGNVVDEAGIAIQLYGTAVGHIASGNISRRTGGFHNFGMNYYGVQPSWFVQWLDNRIESGNVYGGGHDQSVAVGEAHLGAFAMDPVVLPKAPITLGCIIRGNTLVSNAHLGLGGSPDTPASDYPFVQEAVVEGNRVRDALCGLVLSEKGVQGAVIRGNDFSGCDAPVLNELPEGVARRGRLKRLLDQSTASQGPLVQWPLVAGLDDVTNHGFDLVAQGTGAQIVGDSVRRDCLALDGTSRCEVPGSELLNLQTFTLSLWVKPERLAGRFGLVSKRNAGTGSPFIVGTQGNRLSFEAYDVKGHWSFNFMSDPALHEGVWQHVVVVKQLGSGVTLYVDGKSVGHLDNPVTAYANDCPIEIGWEAWGGNPADGRIPAWFKGRLSNLTIWPRAMSGQEVAALP